MELSEEEKKAVEIEFQKRLIIEDIKYFCDLYRKNEGIGEGGLDELADNILSFSKNYIHKDKIREIRDKAEVMDYYSLNDVIDDLSKLIGDYEEDEEGRKRSN